MRWCSDPHVYRNTLRSFAPEAPITSSPTGTFQRGLAHCLRLVQFFKIMYYAAASIKFLAQSLMQLRGIYVPLDYHSRIQGAT